MWVSDDSHKDEVAKHVLFLFLIGIILVAYSIPNLSSNPPPPTGVKWIIIPREKNEIGVFPLMNPPPPPPIMFIAVQGLSSVLCALSEGTLMVKSSQDQKIIFPGYSGPNAIRALSLPQA